MYYDALYTEKSFERRHYIYSADITMVLCAPKVYHRRNFPLNGRGRTDYYELNTIKLSRCRGSGEGNIEKPSNSG